MNFNKQIAAMKDEIVSATQKLVGIRSVQEAAEGEMPYGRGMDTALNYVLELAESMGFTTKKINGYCGYIEYGTGDIYIGVLAHVDVNVEDSEEWKHDPYGGCLEKNRIYGSCAMDKGSLIAALFALKAVRDTVGNLKRKVRLIIGTDERRYYKDIEQYLKNENPPIAGFTTDGHFPVTYAEKGLAMLEYTKTIRQNEDEYIQSLRGGKLDNLISGYCSARLVTMRRSEIISKMEEYIEENRKDISAKILNDGLLIEVYGKEKHGASIESGINSNMIMLDFLRFIEFGDQNMKRIINFLCESIGFDIYGESLNIAYEDEFSGKTTVNMGIIDFRDGELKIRMDCRFPVTCNYIQAIETLGNAFIEAGFEQSECTYWPPTYFPENHFLIKALMEAYQEVTGDDSRAVTSSSASYSKVMPNVAAFGARYPGEVITWDQAEEYLEVDTLEKTAAIYANAIHKLCTEV